MSSPLQNKLYNLETPPPPGVWEKIAADLDESELASQFPSKLYNTTVLPPVHIWQRIAAALDEPLFVQDYSTKLGGAEVIPPAAVWNKIKTSLDTEAETGPVRRRISPFIQYAAAAAILVFLAWGGIRLFNNNKTTEKTTAAESTTPAKEITGTTSTNLALLLQDENIGITGIDASMEEARNDAALEASKNTYAKLDVTTTRSKIKNVSNFFFMADDYDYVSTVNTRSLGIEPIDIASRYITLMTPDGNIIRMSKKLKELVCCVSGEDEDKDCVDQMKKWRDKIANPSNAHSPGNFMDIVSMVNSLQDN